MSADFYRLLGIKPTASVQEIRRAYREQSKLYHPDTTELAPAIATAKFQELNEAYATLSSPDRRAAYDLKHGYSRVRVIQPSFNLDSPSSTVGKARSTRFTEPGDRPLSAGELFALFILGLTFLGCLILVVTIGLTRGSVALEALTPSQAIHTELAHEAPSPTPPQPTEGTYPLKAPMTPSSMTPDLPGRSFTAPNLP
ncbi:J domain-containing protein [Leptolyngbya sp. AN02str]|uniref:J domain-containing protein n=1 Tax=Leptolyngbya sp. AN02str TaxID=3423363 RepID=UPI003D30F390